MNKQPETFNDVLPMNNVPEHSGDLDAYVLNTGVEFSPPFNPETDDPDDRDILPREHINISEGGEAVTLNVKDARKLRDWLNKALP